MKSLDIPFNIRILDAKDDRFKTLRPITSLDIFDHSGVNFHPDGLFSTTTFGRVGEQMRYEKFAYINTKAEIFHPIYYQALIGAKRLYNDIVTGRGYAIWNDKEKDFEASDPINGETGYWFFMQHWREIKIQPTESVERMEKNKLLVNYRHVALTDKVLVIPAAMRDLEVGDDGRTQEDEINSRYRQLLAVSNTVSDEARKNQAMVNDAARYKLQTTFDQIYETLNSIIRGKKKLLTGKWFARNIVDGTRNVISPMDEAITVLGDPNNISANDTVMGLYQAIQGSRLVSVYEFKNGFLSEINNGPGFPVKLINPKTLKQEEVKLSSKDYDRWFSEDGIERLFSSFQSEEVRHREVKVQGKYLALIYLGPDMTAKLMHDIDELPEGRNKADVYPATLAEILYISFFKRSKELPAFITRYPIAGLGSTYPSFLRVKTTVRDEKRELLGDDWTPTGDTLVSFPKRGESFSNTLSPNIIRYTGMGADNDGDMCSGNIAITEEAKDENIRFLKSRNAYIGTDGRLIASANVDTANLVVSNMSR